MTARRDQHVSRKKLESLKALTGFEVFSALSSFQRTGLIVGYLPTLQQDASSMV
jgi:hypothetical protein